MKAQDSNFIDAYEAAGLLEKEEVTPQELVDRYTLPSVADCLRQFMGKRTSKEIFEKAHVSKSSLYRILNGKAAPSRKMILQLAYGLDLTESQKQVLVLCAGFPPITGQDVGSQVMAFYIDHRK